MAEHTNRQGNPGGADAPQTFARGPIEAPADKPALLAVVSAIGIVAMSPYIAAAIASSYAWLVGLGEARAYKPGEFERLLMGHEAVYQAAFDCTVIILTLVAARGIAFRGGPRLALAAPRDGLRAYASALAILAVAASLWFAVAFGIFPRDMLNDMRPYGQLMTAEAGWLMPPIYCLLAPVAEEMLFRGLLFRSLASSRLGVHPAALLSSAGWMLLHVDRSAVGLSQVFALGLLFCFLLVRSGSLRVPIACHIVFNTCLSLIVFATFHIG